MPVNMEVPDWLRPMSQAERERMNLLENETKDKAALMLRKQIGFARMQEQAQQLTNQGVDELTARKRALLDNAPLIFADNPQAVSSILRNDESQAIRERAQSQLNDYHQGLLESAQANRMLRMQLSGEEGDRKRLKDQMEADARTAERERKAQAAEFGAAIAQQKLEGSKEKLAIDAARERRLKQKDVENDPQIKEMVSSLQSAEADLRATKETGKSWWQRQTTFDNHLKALQANRDELKTQLDARKRELLGEADLAPAQPAAKPAAPKTLRLGTIVEQGGKKYRYVGGDTSDPNSFQEVKE